MAPSRCCRAEAAAITFSSPVYSRMQMMFPDYLPLIKWMATYFPTPAQKKAMAAYK